MNRVIIVIPYFGSFPDYFELWIESVRYNIKFDFLLVTDIEVMDYSLPPNIKILNITFEKLKNQMKTILEMDIVLKDPYKLCDYKSTYGCVFEEYIREYEFWGFCDIDLIFGDLSQYVNDNVLDNYDKINYLGHFSLYKNCDVMNNIFRDESVTVTYKDAFATNYSFHFDEHTQWLKVFEKKHIRFFNTGGIADIDIKKRNLTLVSSDKINYRNYSEQIFAWENGKVYRYFLDETETVKKDEWMYIHLQKRNMNNNVRNIKDGYVILPENFEEGCDIAREFISSNSKKKIIWLKYYKRRYRDIKKQIKNGAVKIRLNNWLKDDKNNGG